LFGFILRHPAADGGRPNAHALAYMLNAETLFFNHTDDFQLETGIETSALPCHVKLLEGELKPVQTAQTQTEASQIHGAKTM
jgi:hypothetical protein